jgi:hypothetical protein
VHSLLLVYSALWSRLSHGVSCASTERIGSIGCAGIPAYHPICASVLDARFHAKSQKHFPFMLKSFTFDLIAGLLLILAGHKRSKENQIYAHEEIGCEEVRSEEEVTGQKGRDEEEEVTQRKKETRTDPWQLRSPLQRKRRTRTIASLAEAKPKARRAKAKVVEAAAEADRAHTLKGNHRAFGSHWSGCPLFF